MLGRTCALTALVSLTAVAGEGPGCMECVQNKDMHWCQDDGSCQTRAQWLADKKCTKWVDLDSQSECPDVMSKDEQAPPPTNPLDPDECRNYDSCGDCTSASFTTFAGEYQACVWCRESESCLRESSADTCANPQSLCTGPGGSDKTCMELNWPLAPGAVACGASRIDGQCSGLLSYYDAKVWCTEAGARLCSSEELQSSIGMGSGCKLDSARIWTQDFCAAGHVTHAATAAFLPAVPRKCEESSTLRAVRCCADQPGGRALAPPLRPLQTCDLLGWGSAPGHPSVCASSKPGGVCITAASFEVAQSACWAEGARLCTAEELFRDEAKGSGCRLDAAAVWSSTICPGGALTARGSSNPASASNTPQCTRLSEQAGVRCCANYLPGEGPTDLSCEQLGWPVQAGACAKSKVNGQCSPALNAWEAVEFCNAAGAQVCSRGQLISGLAQNSGCGLNTVRVWSSTPCPGGYFTQVGTGLPQCAAPEVLHPVRCCAASSLPVASLRP